MNYFVLWFIPICMAFHSYPHSSHLHSTRLYQDKNTPYGLLDSIPLSDIYKGLESKSIQDLYISNDMKDIYILEKNANKMSRVIHSNPILTEHIVESAIKKEIKTVILEPTSTIFEEGGKIMGGMFDFIFITFAISILLRFLGSVIKGPMNILFTQKQTIVDSETRLTDWAGSPEVFEECFEVVSYVSNTTIYEAAGAVLPKGILLDGPPGTGKTLLAKAIAGETNATFFSVSGSEFVELFVGLGASKVRDLFDEARENAPSIIFIDEIDAIGKKRSPANTPNTNDEREQTLNQILSEMDGFQPNTGVLVIAATNRRDVLDDALLRPGRFDRLIYVPLPDQPSREAILRLYLKGKTVDKNVDIKYIAQETGGFSGAQLKNLLNEAAILAARNGNTIVTKDNLEDALEKIVVGITKRVDTRSLEARTRVAIHELGHAILAGYFSDVFELKKVSLKQTYNGIGGFTLFSEKADIQESGLYTKDVMMKRIIVSLGGKAAEIIEYGDDGVSVGASQDLKEANELARSMVEVYGMGESLEAFSFPMSDNISEKTCETVDDAVHTIIEHCRIEAKRLLECHTNVSLKLRVQLLSENILDGQTVIDALF